MVRTPREASASSALTERPRPPTGPSVGSGSASVEARPGTQGVPETVTIGRPLPVSSRAQCDESGAFLGDGPGEAVRIAVVPAERQADHAVRLGGAGPQDVEVRDLSAQRFGPGVFECPRRGVRAGQCENGMAVAEQFGDDGGADGAGTAGDENIHEALLK